jgi:hypothetical protein
MLRVLESGLESCRHKVNNSVLMILHSTSQEWSKIDDSSFYVLDPILVTGAGDSGMRFRGVFLSCI